MYLAQVFTLFWYTIYIFLVNQFCTTMLVCLGPIGPLGCNGNPSAPTLSPCSLLVFLFLLLFKMLSMTRMLWKLKYNAWKMLLGRKTMIKMYHCNYQSSQNVKYCWCGFIRNPKVANQRHWNHNHKAKENQDHLQNQSHSFVRTT